MQNDAIDLDEIIDRAEMPALTFDRDPFPFTLRALDSLAAMIRPITAEGSGYRDQGRLPAQVPWITHRG